MGKWAEWIGRRYRQLQILRIFGDWRERGVYLIQMWCCCCDYRFLVLSCRFSQKAFGSSKLLYSLNRMNCAINLTWVWGIGTLGMKKKICLMKIVGRDGDWAQILKDVSGERWRNLKVVEKKILKEVKGKNENGLCPK